MDNFIFIIAIAVSSSLIFLSYILNRYEEKKAKIMLQKELKRFIKQVSRGRRKKHFIKLAHR